MPAGRRHGRTRAPRFSVVTIVRNEAARLPQLLESLGDFRARGGEVVVLDTGSDDGTPEVAAAAGCRVFVEPKRFNRRLTEGQASRIQAAFARQGEGPFVTAGERLFHFGRARAWAASLAAHDFQLAVDGGDRIEAMDVDFLDAAARSTHAPILHFETRMLNPGGWALEVRDYLYDRRRAAWRGRSHNYLEPVEPGSAAERSVLGRDQLLVSHHTDLRKARGYQLAGTALEALAQPRSFRWRYFLARGLAATGRHHSARELFLSLDRPGAPPAVRSSGLCSAAHCLARTGGTPDEIESLLFKAAARDSARRDPWLNLAARRLDEGDLQGAVSFATAALAIPARAGLSEPEENFSTRPHTILYWALFWLGRREEAKTHFDACRRLDPGNPVYRDHARLFG